MEKKNYEKVLDINPKGQQQAVVEEEKREERSPTHGPTNHTEEKIENAKFYMGEVPWPVAPTPRELPGGYGDNKIVLMVIDPWWAHSYWEVSRDKVQEGLRVLGTTLDDTKSVLRVYDVTGLEGTERSHHSFDIELKGLANSWYLHLNTPDRSHRVDIGLLTREGKFFCLARSNTVTLPRASMSDVIDERWLSQDFEKLYALSGGFKLGSSSVALKEQMEKRFQEALFSGAVSSFGVSPVKKKERAFWFVLDTELIVYGATEPDAQVTVSGKPVQLRPDGTFTLRFALPDGRFSLPATARSSDGKEERTITPTVERSTEVSRPVFKDDRAS